MTGKPFVAPIKPNTLSFDDKMKVLEAVNLIKEKICGKIKGRTCAYGSNQKYALSRLRTSRHPWCL